MLSCQQQPSREEDLSEEPILYPQEKSHIPIEIYNMDDIHAKMNTQENII